MRKQSIKKNYILNTIYQILALLTPLITAPYISKTLGATGVGIYSYTTSVEAFFSLFAILGTSVYGQREIAQCREDKHTLSKTFWEIELLSILCTVVCTGLWLVFIQTEKEYSIYFLILTMDLLSAGLDITWFYSGLENFSFIVIRNVIIKIVNIISIFLLVKTKNDVWIYMAILSVGNLLGKLSLWFPIRKLIEKVPLSSLDVRQHIKETLVYFIPTIASSVYTYLDKIMIEKFTGSTVENGYYEQANKIIKMSYSCIISLNTVMSSRMSYLFSIEKTEEIKQKLEKALAFIVTFSIALVLGICSISFNFVPWFFGDEFIKVGFLLILGSPLILILAMHNFLAAQYLIPSGQRVRSTIGVLTGMCVNFLLNLLLIPRFKSAGALIATLASETSICVVYLYMSRKFVPFTMVLCYIPKQLFAGVVMFAVCTTIGWGHSGSVIITIAQIFSGCIVYMAVLFILKEKFILNVTKDIYMRIKRHIRR